MSTKFIAYYRVSTKRQGESGLGLSSQKSSVTSYVKSLGGDLLAEFTDVESGGKDDREQLAEAIKLAVTESATLVVKKLDRLSRGGFKIATQLDELGIKYIDCESPEDSPFIKDIKFSIAKEEKAKISDRITSALDEIQKNIDEKGYHISKVSGRKITSLGNVENLGGEAAVQRSIEVRKRKARNNPNNQRASAVIKMMKESGKSFYAITKFLNENGFLTSRGNEFSQVQTKKLYERL